LLWLWFHAVKAQYPVSVGTLQPLADLDRLAMFVFYLDEASPSGPGGPSNTMSMLRRRAVEFRTEE